MKWRVGSKEGVTKSAKRRVPAVRSPNDSSRQMNAKTTSQRAWPSLVDTLICAAPALPEMRLPTAHPSLSERYHTRFSSCAASMARLCIYSEMTVQVSQHLLLYPSLGSFELTGLPDAGTQSCY